MIMQSIPSLTKAGLAERTHEMVVIECGNDWNQKSPYGKEEMSRAVEMSLVRFGPGLLKEGYFCHFSCSMLAGVVAAGVTSPVDLAKSRIMTQPLNPEKSACKDGASVSF